MISSHMKKMSLLRPITWSTSPFQDAGRLCWLSGKITITLLSVWPISLPDGRETPFRAMAETGMVMPFRPHLLPLQVWHLMIFVAACPFAGPRSAVALGYLMSLFCMVCQSDVTVQDLSNGGGKRGEGLVWLTEIWFKKSVHYLFCEWIYKDVIQYISLSLANLHNPDDVQDHTLPFNVSGLE